ncbi:MAG: carbohydrate ABC transporter permease [Eubacteriales bacterium]|nr:carbohydrate ABC transporter permease [Eubacteriales bacterium]
MKKYPLKEAPFDILNLTLMLIVLLGMMYPFWYVLVYSISDASSASSGLFLWPAKISFDSYVTILKSSDILNGLWISSLRAILGAFTMIVVSSMTAYAMSKDHLPGIKGIRKFILFSMYVSGGLIPTYMVIKGLGLTNTFAVYILPGMASVFNIILIRAYMENLPPSLEESAYIDGANDFQIFRSIVLPLSKPVIAAVSLYTAVGQWNSYIDTQIYNYRNPDLYPLQYILFNYLAAYTPSREAAKMHIMTVTPYSMKMAITIVTILPILFVYPFLQRYFISGLLVGSVKA